MAEHNHSGQGTCYDDELIESIFTQAKAMDNVDEVLQAGLLQSNKLAEAKGFYRTESKIVHSNLLQKEISDYMAKIDKIEQIVSVEEDNLSKLESTIAALESVYKISPNVPISVIDLLSTVTKQFGGGSSSVQHRIWIPPSVELPKLKSFKQLDSSNQ